MSNFTTPATWLSEVVSINLLPSNRTLTDTQKTQMWFDEIVSKINFCSMLFGIFGNLICVGVLAHKKMLKKKFHFYLLALAFSDLFYCLIVFSNYVVFIFDPPNLLYDFSRFTCYFTDYIYKSFDATGVILTLIVSLDRTCAITRPIAFRNFFTLRFPKTIIIVASKLKPQYIPIQNSANFQTNMLYFYFSGSGLCD